MSFQPGNFGSLDESNNEPQPMFCSEFTASPEPMEGFVKQEELSPPKLGWRVTPNFYFDRQLIPPEQVQENVGFDAIDPSLRSLPSENVGLGVSGITSSPDLTALPPTNKDARSSFDKFMDEYCPVGSGLGISSEIPTEFNNGQVPSVFDFGEQPVQDPFGAPETQFANQTNLFESEYPDPNDYQFNGLPYQQQDFAEFLPVQELEPQPQFVRMDMRRKRPVPLDISVAGSRPSRRGDIRRTPTPPETPMSGDMDYVPAGSPASGPVRRRRRAKDKTYRPEKPKKDKEKEWVRVNHSTQGTSTRTGKINHFDPVKDGQYRNTEHPNGYEWQSCAGTVFKYNRWGELSRTTFTANEMQEFIYENPSRTVLWIQKGAADSARRYPTRDSNKCRFLDCPAKPFKRTINVGHFRVAIDDQWMTHGSKRDPFHVAGYVHLYCLERFCDFKHMAETLDVRVDDRVFDNEPRGKFPPALPKNSRELSVARNFIEACSNKMLPFTFPQYPLHQQYPVGAPKPHELTLNYAMNQAKLAGSSRSKVAQLENRGGQESNCVVHLGDLSRYVRARRQRFAEFASARGNKQAQAEDWDEEARSAIQDWNNSTLFNNPSSAPSEIDQTQFVAPNAFMGDNFGLDPLIAAGFDGSSQIEPLPTERKRQASSRAAASEANKRIRLVDYGSDSSEDENDAGLFVEE